MRLLSQLSSCWVEAESDRWRNPNGERERERERTRKGFVFKADPEVGVTVHALAKSCRLHISGSRATLRRCALIF